MTSGRITDLKGQKAHIAYIALGGNIDDPKETLARAIDRVREKVGHVQRQSSLYRSEPWGMPKETPWFINQGLEVHTHLSPSALMDALLNIEQAFGRERKGKGASYTSRSIDLDILYYDHDVIETEKVSIPHPRLHLRRFTLEIMAELAPDMNHPTIDQTQLQLLESCEDRSIVERI